MSRVDTRTCIFHECFRRFIIYLDEKGALSAEKSPAHQLIGKPFFCQQTSKFLQRMPVENFHFRLFVAKGLASVENCLHFQRNVLWIPRIKIPLQPLLAGSGDFQQNAVVFSVQFIWRVCSMAKKCTFSQLPETLQGKSSGSLNFGAHPNRLASYLPRRKKR